MGFWMSLERSNWYCRECGATMNPIVRGSNPYHLRYYNGVREECIPSGNLEYLEYLYDKSHSTV